MCEILMGDKAKTTMMGCNRDGIGVMSTNGRVFLR